MADNHLSRRAVFALPALPVVLAAPAFAEPPEAIVDLTVGPVQEHHSRDAQGRTWFRYGADIDIVYGRGPHLTRTAAYIQVDLSPWGNRRPDAAMWMAVYGVRTPEQDARDNADPDAGVRLLPAPSRRLPDRLV